MPRSAWLVFGAMLALGLGVWLLPGAFEAHPRLASTPVAPPAGPNGRAIALRRGAQACMDSVALPRETRTARIVAGGGQAGTLSVVGSGYSSAARFPGGYVSGAQVDVELRPPPRDLLARVCVRGPTRLYGVTPRSGRDDSEPRPALRIDGRPRRERFTLTLVAAGESSLAARADRIVERAALFKPWWAPEAVIWLVAALALLGVPLAVALALRGAFKPE